jgi:hypothetical protein
MTLHPTSRAFDLLGVAERLLRDAADLCHLDGSADAATIANKLDGAAVIAAEAGEALLPVMAARFEAVCQTRTKCKRGKT